MTKDFPLDDGETRPDPSDLRIATVAVPYTQVHTMVRRLLENLQDVVVSLLLVLLLVLSLQAIWRIGVVALTGPVMTNQVLSEILFVLILTEVYRLLIYYLSEHRVSVSLTVEVALVSTLREVILKGAHEFEWLRIVGLSLLLVVLGGLLAVEHWMGQGRNAVSESSVS